MINAKECVIIDSLHTFKRAWLLEKDTMRKPKILLFDLDGTLLRNDKTLSSQQEKYAVWIVKLRSTH